MSAQMRPRFETAQVAFAPLLAQCLDAVMQVEQGAYAHPWSRANFLDALHSGYQAQVLLADDVVLGYFVAMLGVEEVHLLNLTVAPEFQGQGWARVLLDALSIWARGQNAAWLWLEVRTGNARAMRVYEAAGFARVGLRKAYYPAAHGQREDAWVMGLRL
jgi:ribosomal-protein-alanine N-acetyltransferase